MKRWNLVIVGVLLAVLIMPLLPQITAKAYPLYSVSGNATVASYGANVTAGAPNFSGGSNVTSGYYRSYLTVAHSFRIRQNGTITAVRWYSAGNATNTTDFRITVWRAIAPFDGTCTLIGSTENLSSQLVDGTFVTANLSSPITGVQEGDFYGYIIDTVAASQSVLFATTPGGTATTRFYNAPVTSNTSFNWATPGPNGVSSTTGVVSIDLYMIPPQVSFITDSIGSHPLHYSYAEDTDTNNITSSMEYQFGNITGYSYQNMAIGSQNSTQIANRFASDVIAKNPKLVVAEGGVNNFVSPSPSESIFLADWTSMLSAAQSASSVQAMIVLKILPWTNGTNTQMQTIDQWNTDLAALSANYSKAIVVDASPYVGQFRVGGTSGNLWDIQAAYDSGDGVHYNQAGHTKMAQALAAILADLSATTLTAQISMDKDGVTSGNISANLTALAGLQSTARINIGTTIAYGINTTDAIFNSLGVKYFNITSNLTPGQTYHFRVSANNTSNTTVGSDSTFIFTLPSVTTGTVTQSGNQATLNGNVTNMGVASSTYRYFEWWQNGVPVQTTPLGTSVATGAYNSTITFDTLKEVSYRAVTQVGSVKVYGATLTFSSGTIATSGNLFWTILPMIVAAGVIIACAALFMRTLEPGLLVAGVVGGLVSYVVTVVLVNAFFR